MKGKRCPWGVTFAVGVSLFGLTSARADVAVVVGVQEYPNLDSMANMLEGCVNDATSMAQILSQKYRFRVTFIKNRDATKAKILTAIREAAANVKPNERFVFFFAGHGRTEPDIGLMASDAVNVNINNPKELGTISPQELSEALKAVPARSKTVILDACHSGAMSKNLSRLRARFYEPPSSRGAKNITFRVAKANGGDASHTFDTAGGQVCYVTACRSHEQAFEAVQDDGKPHGLFSWNLMEHLDGDTPGWDKVISDVTKGVVERTSREGVQQNPTLSPAFQNAPMFESKEIPTGTPQSARTVADIFALQRVDPAALSVRVTPDQSNFQLGEFLSFELKIGKPGYLVFLGQMGRRIYLAYPFAEGNAPLRAESAKVEPGTVYLPPRDSDIKARFDRVGQDQVKAFLFATQEQAQAVIDAVRKATQGENLDAELPKILEVRAEGSGVVTSAISFDVGDALVGGMPLANPTALFRKLAGNDPVATYVRSSMSLADWDEIAGSAPTSGELDQASVHRLVFGLNLLLQEADWLSENPLTRRQLPDDLRALVNSRPKPGTPERAQLNRRLLEFAFPTETVGNARAGGSQ